MAEPQLIKLAQWLAGDFSNWEQAIENPPFFAHVRVCMRPLPVPPTPTGVWLYVEQAYDYELHIPYRTAVLHLQEQGADLVIVNYKLKNPQAYFGSARQPDRLAQITIHDLEQQCGCNMLIQHKGNEFTGVIEPGKKCCVQRKGRDTYLHSEFTVGADFFRSWDQGFDLVTNERVWGAIAGAFEFRKRSSFANEVASYYGDRLCAS
ncbi:MAG: chromophore lyase CpcT/CpeT [Pseudanabaenaceae cyanobacterium]